jgi:C-terminal processing protease CtpA/Prc
LFGYWTRIYPENNLSTKDKIQLAFTKPHPTLPFIEKLSDKTVYLRIPSFLTDQKINIDSVLLKNDKLITSTPNLIIDIRNGTGGNTHSYKNIIPYLYTNTIRGMDNQYYATELNIKGYEHFAKEASDTSDSNYCNHVAKMMKEHLGEFITLSNQNYSTKTLDKTLPYPQRIAVICNNYNGSADEGFLLDAKQSTKVKVFGTPTMGVLDIANLASVYSPDDKFILHYGMTRSLRIPDFCIDNIGIQPDYFIDDSTKEEDWIGYTQKILEQ